MSWLSCSMKSTAKPVSPNPFNDTTNPKILKAFALGITKGTSATAFTPNKTISRQECATMLFRAIRAIAPKADYSIAGVPDFPDQKDIDSWAAEGTKYMFKLGIIKGDNRGYFEALSEVSGQTTETKYWKKGSMVKKVETGSSDNKTKTDIFDMSKGVAYSYYEGSAEAVKSVYTMSDPSKHINPFNFTGPFILGSVQESADTKITGNETINGVSCSVITTTIDGEICAKIWVSEDGLKRRSETVYFGFPMTTLYKNYKIGGSISDSEFELPPGMTVDEDVNITITE